MTPERKKKLRQVFCIMMALTFIIIHIIIIVTTYHQFSSMSKHIINSHLRGRPPLSPFNHQLLMREAAKQLKIEQEKKEAERRKVIFFNNLFVIIVIFPLLITIYSIISQRRIREVVQKTTFVRSGWSEGLTPPPPLRQPDRKKTVFWMTFLI